MLLTITESVSDISGLWQDILSHPLESLFVVANLIIIESLLSVDNAAVLATMVMDLPSEQRNKALKYGIIGAYVFRGLSLLFASFLIRIWWLKPLGGLYLIYLAVDHFRPKSQEGEEVDKENNRIYKRTSGMLGHFWATVALVELMDMAFSIDNVFAAVAFSPNILLIWTGVFIGILAMRFVAQGFVSLMEKYPFLETSAFIVIALLGFKLLLSVAEKLLPDTALAALLGSHTIDYLTSLITVGIFFIPILSSRFFNFPANKTSGK